MFLNGISQVSMSHITMAKLYTSAAGLGALCLTISGAQYRTLAMSRLVAGQSMGATPKRATLTPVIGVACGASLSESKGCAPPGCGSYAALSIRILEDLYVKEQALGWYARC